MTETAQDRHDALVREPPAEHAALADALAAQLAPHFPGTETQTAGRTLLRAAGACSEMARDVSPQSLLNILGMAGGVLAGGEVTA